MTRYRPRRSGAVLATSLLLFPLSARAAAAENFFAALGAATVVSRCTIEQVDQPAGSSLIIFRVRASDALKGDVPPPASPLSVVQELVFPSDVPVAAKGASGLCLLKTMPQYSAYRSVLTAGPYYRFGERERPIVSPSVEPAARAWLALQQQPTATRADKRVLLLLEQIGDALIGADALAELGTTVDLGPLLDRVGYDRIGGVVRDTRIPLDRRRGLLTLLVDHHVTGALPMLQSVQDVELAPFLHQAIAALGGRVPMAQLRADLQANSDDQRLAGLDALARSAARSTDAKMRSDAVTTLATVAAHDDSSTVRMAAVDHLGLMGNEAVPAIEELLKQPDTHVVYASGRALGAIGSPAATRMLAQQFKQGSYDAQVAAVLGLRAIDTPEATQILTAVKANPPDPRLPRVIDLTAGKEPSHK